MTKTKASDRCYVIAEAGVNHNGDLDKAAALIQHAADAGADAVKFQTFKAESVVTGNARKAEYQITNTQEDGSQIEMIRKLELSFDAFRDLAEIAERHGIEFLSTAFDGDSLKFLADDLQVRRLKIPSGEMTNGPYLLSCARIRRPMFVSTGMCTMADIAAALDVIAYGLTSDETPRGSADFAGCATGAAGAAALRETVTLLHCTTEYPTPLADVNLRAMDSMAARFGLPVGYSDHTQGISVPIAAAARGAQVIEKHFTLDRNLPGPDHAASLEPDELSAMVGAIRDVSSALGREEKAPAESELKNMPIARRSLVAARPIRKGEPVTAENVTAKRPGDGISPMGFWDMQGQPAARDYEPDEQIEP